jgi:hypothetical protein
MECQMCPVLLVHCTVESKVIITKFLSQNVMQKETAVSNADYTVARRTQGRGSVVNLHLSQFPKNLRGPA